MVLSISFREVKLKSILKPPEAKKHRISFDPDVEGGQRASKSSCGSDGAIAMRTRRPSAVNKH